MLSLQDLAQRVTPERTVLFLGAGASVASGGPTGAGLAASLCQSLAAGETISSDLMEVASILEQRRGAKPWSRQ